MTDAIVRRVAITVALLALSAAPAAAQLTEAQKVTLKAHMSNPANAEVFSLFEAGNAAGLVAYYNAPDPANFVVWKTNVTIGMIGDNIVATELAGLTSLNVTRLQVIAAYSPQGVNPSLADRRAFFDDIFSGAGGQQTRAKLLALWKRLSSRIERIFATGTGSDAVPATLVFEGKVTLAEMQSAILK